MKRKRNVILLVVVVLICAVCILSAVAQEWPTTRPRDARDMPPSRFRGPDGREIGPQVTDEYQEAVRRLDYVTQCCRTWSEATFNPEKAGVMAVLQLETDFRRNLGLDETIRVLLDLLEHTKTLGLRNMLRVAIKDMYKAQGDSSKAVEQLIEIVKENDQALREAQKAQK